MRDVTKGVEFGLRSALLLYSLMLTFMSKPHNENNEDEEQVLSVRPPRRGWGVQASGGEFLPLKLKSRRVSQG